ncbi:MAG TPA: hypothetical protein VFO89_13110, partial [Thermoanaerobaculia bacterium]|nr:hypothetical protein [Thermoanaerobaculia bacterium]
MKMKDHYSEADLLETYYTQPGESMPVMMHLADCADCAARYERLERKVRGLAACEHDEKPETFWARQRLTILRRIGQQQPQAGTFSLARLARVAAAAVLLLVLGGVIAWNRIADVPPPAPQQPTQTAKAVVPAEPTPGRQTEDSTDPWQSDELKEFGSMVEWESWVENGDQ